MNLMKHVRVTKKEFESWLQYLKDSGYTVTLTEKTDYIFYGVRNANGFTNLDYNASKIWNKVTHRWERWISIRVPQSELGGS